MDILCVTNKIDEALAKTLELHGDIEISGIDIAPGLLDDLQDKTNYVFPDVIDELKFLVDNSGNRRLAGYLMDETYNKIPVSIDDSLKPNQVVFHTL